MDSRIKMNGGRLGLIAMIELGLFSQTITIVLKMAWKKQPCTTMISMLQILSNSLASELFISL